jgi:protein TonB
VWSAASRPARREARRDRVRSAVGVALVHLLIGYALISSLGFRPALVPAETLKLFDIAAEPPPEPRPAPQPKAQARSGEAAPPNLEARATPVVAPPPRIRIEVAQALGAAPIAGSGSDTRAGASQLPGPGTGAGGEGAGTGAGGEGNGPGGGGVATPARHLRGRIDDDDYPRGAYRERVGGTVIARVTVSPEGRVSRCEVNRSSGNAELDATTCRLIERRFRFSPALDAEGRAMASQVGWRQEWWLEGRR